MINLKIIQKKTSIYINTLKHILTDEINVLKNNVSMIEPPFNPFKIKKIQDAEIIIEFCPRSKIGAEGKLEILDNKFLIKIDEKLQFTKKGYRLRTTIAHELMHTFFYKLENNKLMKLGSGSFQKKHIFAEENLCNYLSREFLVPANSLKKNMEADMELTKGTIRNINYLKSKYIVSSNVLAWRLFKDLELWDGIFAKYSQNKLIFKPATLLKYKPNKRYNRIHLPKSIPSDKNYWHNKITSTIEKTIENDYTYSNFSYNNHDFILESAVDSTNPLSVIILIRSINSKNL